MKHDYLKFFEYIRLIEDCDATISAMREFWMDALTKDGRERNMRRIDALLDERLRLMALRDMSRAMTISLNRP